MTTSPLLVARPRADRGERLTPVPLDGAEEAASATTHGLGAIASGAALALLVARAAWFGEARHVVGAAVFGVTLVFLYAASTVYHAARSPRLRYAAKIVDHAGIYLLIAGSYTPFTLVSLRGPLGVGLLAAVWAAAALGVATEALWVYRPRWVSAVVYLAMGWMVVVASPRLAAAMSTTGFALVVGGGLLYSLGTVFYVMKRVRYMHAIWHLFVIGGSACHVLAVLGHVLPGPR